jgi:hypothetical protein
MWGLGRPLHLVELARALRISRVAYVRDYERGAKEVSGPISAAVDMMLAGAPPPDGLQKVLVSHG